MGSKKKPKMKVVQYFMTGHYGVCTSVDKVLQVIVGEKQAWSGDVETSGTVSVNKQGLFGGIKKEGGVAGLIDIMMGDPAQSQSQHIAERVGKSSTDIPGYRGMLSLFFRGDPDGSGGSYSSGGFFGSIIGVLGLGGIRNRGFYWIANTPYLKTIWVEVGRWPKELDPAVAKIPRGDGGFDANPASIIYQCLTDTDWGLGTDPADLDISSFLAAAQTLYDEQLGISLMWTMSAALEDFMNDILDHIKGAIFTNPRTGRLSIRLVRNDYDVNTLREINPDNATVNNFARKTWGETTNEMKVTWTNPATEGEETVYAQDLGNIAMQGAVISDSRNYHGVRRAELAQQLAYRELRSSSAPLSACEAELDRSFWDITPYEVVKVSYPEYGIESLIMRVVNVSYGQTGNSKIKVSLVEDIFGLPIAQFVTPPSSDWVNPVQPVGLATQCRILPLPAYALDATGDLVGLEHPATWAAVLVPNPTDTNSPASFDVAAQVVGPSGSSEWSLLMNGHPFQGHGELPSALVTEVESVIDFPTVWTHGDVGVDFFLLIGDFAAPAEDLELTLITNINTDTGKMTLLRGALDTVPKPWPAGTKIISVPISSIATYPNELTDGESLTLRIITNSAGTQTDLNDAPEFTGTVKSRAALPTRPANLKAGGSYAPTQQFTDTVELTWSERNRLLEGTVIYRWDDPSVTSEPGTSYMLHFDGLDVDGNLIAPDMFEIDVGMATSYTLDLTTNPTPNQVHYVRVRAEAVRDGLLNWQSAKVRFRVFSAPTNLSGSFTPD